MKSTETWPEFRTDRYTKASKLVKYLKQEFGDNRYQIASQSDIYIIKTPTKLTDEQVNEINGLSARVSARGNSSRIKSNGLSRNCNEPRSANLPGPIPLTSLSSNHTVVEGADEPAQDILSAMDHTMLEALEETSQDNIQEENTEPRKYTWISSEECLLDSQDHKDAQDNGISRGRLFRILGETFRDVSEGVMAMLGRRRLYDCSRNGGYIRLEE